MSSPRILMLCFAACLALTPPLSGAPQPKGFDGLFSVLKTRNIFDSQRQPGLQSQSAPAVTRSDFAALTGILVTNDKVLAFFSGSRPEFNAVLPPYGVIAGAVITRIAPDFIEVNRDGKITAIAVGNTVPLDANATSGPAPAMDSASSSSTTNPTASPSTSSPSGPTPDREALIRRMMEKRQKELR